jgi:cell division protein FtsN
VARDYKNSKSKPKGRALGSWVSFVSGLGVGLLCAVVVYFWRINSPISPPTAHAPDKVASEPVEKIRSSSALDFDTQMDQALPKHEFEFYKILPETEVKVPEWEISTPSEKTEDEFEQGAYVLQVGSYQQHKDADRAKAKLALLGIIATIHRVVINGQDVWYRVHVGPFSDLAKIQATRSKLIESGSDFILLKIGDAAG